jgi:carbohydrate diacid regulator
MAQTGEAISIGIGRYHPGISGLAASFTDARTALTLGGRLYGPNRVHCLDDLGIGAFVGLEDERTKIDLAHHLLSPLDHEYELIETLEAFFAADCSPADAARRLRIHRNTLAYRLAKVASLTGLDPRRFDDAVQIRLALVLRGLGDRPIALVPHPPTPAPDQSDGRLGR